MASLGGVALASRQSGQEGTARGAAHRAKDARATKADALAAELAGRTRRRRPYGAATIGAATPGAAKRHGTSPNRSIR
jgi:hypothetical protein